MPVPRRREPETIVKTIKVGGSSVVVPEKVLHVLRHHGFEKSVLVVSALKGVTDKLLKVAASRDVAAQDGILKEILQQHEKLLCETLGDHLDDDQLVVMSARLNEYYESRIALVREHCATLTRDDSTEAQFVDHWICLGELFSAQLLRAIFTRLETRAKFQVVDLSGSVDTNVKYKDTSDMAKFFRVGVRDKLRSIIATSEPVVTIVPGHPGTLAGGTVMELTDRGYSDWTAVQVARSLAAWHQVRLVISKEIAGLYSVDPQKYDTVNFRKEISKREMEELAAAEGMKAVNPSAATAFTEKADDAEKNAIEMRITDTFHPEQSGTKVVNDNTKGIGKGVRFVTGKENQSVIRIHNSAMVNQSGWLEQVFAIFKDYKISVDIITSSSASIIVTVDSGASRLDELMLKLKETYGDAEEVYKNSAVVYCVGHNLTQDRSYMNRITTAFNKARVHFTPIGTDIQSNAVFLVQSSQFERAIRAISKIIR